MSTVTYGPYSPVLKAGEYIFTSGQVGVTDPNTGKDIEGVEAQTKQCFNNVKNVLASVGASLSDVVKVTVFLKEAGDFTNMNETYKNYFPEKKPARSTVVTSLVDPRMLIEIECIAYCPSG